VSTTTTTTATVGEVRPLTGALGAEVLGIDLTDLDDARWHALYATWLEHLVLFFPGQSLDPDAHVELGRRFGTPEIHPYIPKRDDEHPEIVVIDTVGGGAEFWHTDVTFSPTPPMASILQMVMNPPRGGDTMFTNQYLAYEMLSEPMRDLLQGLTAVHSAAPFGHPEQNVTHPVVRTHPDTGRQSLFVNRTFTSHVVELQRSESDALLDYLYTWSEQPRFQCRYAWHEGTIGIWDNRCTQHYAVPDYDERRIIERVTVIGDVPFGGTARWQPYTRERGLQGYARDETGGMKTDPRANSMEARSDAPSR
jgi:alpha-ketoglutarate-dependent taurine dioxygenase